MSVFCTKESDAYRQTLANNLPHLEFVVDSSTELSSLPTNSEAKVLDGARIGPCAPGSIAIVPESSEIYILNAAGHWRPMFAGRSETTEGGE